MSVSGLSDDVVYPRLLGRNGASTNTRSVSDIFKRTIRSTLGLCQDKAPVVPYFTSSYLINYCTCESSPPDDQITLECSSNVLFPLQDTSCLPNLFRSIEDQLIAVFRTFLSPFREEHV